MPFAPSTVAGLVAEVEARCAIHLIDVGLFLRGSGGTGTIPAVMAGIRRGYNAVQHTLIDPSTLQDPDVVALSADALERVEDEAELYSLQQALARWYLASKGEQEAVSSTPVASGWRLEQKAGVKARVSELKAICDRPYREPSDPSIVVHRNTTYAAGSAVPTIVNDPPPDGYPGYGAYGPPCGPYWGCP